MTKRILAAMLSMAMLTASMTACSSTEEVATTTDPETSTEQSVVEETTEEKTEEAEEVVVEDYSGIAVETATAEAFAAMATDEDATTVLVDARPQEAYSGWALEGAVNGGHFIGAANFSARWLDCEYAAAADRNVYLQRAMNDQQITADSTVIVYDYTGEQATPVAQYLIGNGVKNVTIYQANAEIDLGTGLESYDHYDYFVPTEIVKSVSDVVTGKETELTADAAELFGTNLSNVMLIDVAWGNAGGSTYFTVGHVPGSVHINTDSYERPRVYVPEKRSSYAKEWRLISLEEFRDDVCTQYGITKDTIAILTGTSGSPQGRLASMLRSVGVETYVMSGLLTAWKSNEYPLDTDPSTLVIPTAVESFGSNTIADPDEILWMDDILAIYNGEVEGQIVDNRGEEEWLGLESGYGYHDLSGRIDGSIWCAQNTDGLGSLFENADATPRTTEEYIAYMESNGLDTNQTMAFFCGDSWGAALISYWCRSTGVENAKQWGNGWIPWSNEGYEFVDHNGDLVHYDKYLDTVVDAEGNDMRDGVNILD